MSMYSPTVTRSQRQRQDYLTVPPNERWMNDISALELYEQALLGALRSGTDPNAKEVIETYEGYEPPTYDEAVGRRCSAKYAEKFVDITRKRREIIRTLRSSPEHQALSPFEQLLIETEYYTGVREWSVSAASSQRMTLRGRSHASCDDKGGDDSRSQALEMLHLSDTPSYIRGKLREYQIEGVNWLLSLFSRGVNGILADEMGLGKTFQTIATIAYLKFTVGMPGPHLIVCPKSVLGNWFREFKRWSPALKVYKFHCASDVRPSILKTHLYPTENLKYDVIVTTFEMVLEEINTFKKVAWKYLVVDEAHKLKNEDSRAHLALTSLTTWQRLIITGTPLQNNLRELWALLHFLAPDLFTEAAAFEAWFDTASGQQDAEVMSNIHKMLAPLMLRRLKMDVNTGIPPKKEIYVSCKLTKKQREWYLHILSNDAEVLNKGKGGTSALTNLLMELRKVINHPYLIDGVEEGPPFLINESIVKVSGKMQILDKLLHRLQSDVEGHHKVLIFSQFTTMLDILEDYCKMRQFKTHRIDGSTSGYDRETQMATFNAPNSESFVFLLSTRAGGLGINLQAANHVIIYDSDWNPQMDLQAQDRAHRIGQKRSVRVYRFVTDGTVEEKIYRRALKKLYLDAVVVQQGRIQSKAQQNVSKAELLSMIKFGAEEIFKSRHEDVTEADIDFLLDQGETRSAELAAETKQQVSMSLASFELGAEEANIYEFEGVSFKSGVESRMLFLRMKEPVAQSVLERECQQYGEVLKVVLHPNLSQALVSFRSVGDAMEAKEHLPYESSYATKENQAIVSNSMIMECVGGGEKLGRGHRVREAVKYFEEEEGHRRPVPPKGLAIRPAPKYPSHQLFNAKRLTDIHEKETALLYQRAQKAAQEVNADPATPADTEVLSKVEQEERAALLSQGFPSWTFREYRAVLVPLMSGAVHLTDYNQLAEHVGTKDAQEVKEYVTALMERGEQCIKDFDRIEARIKRGQEKLREKEAILRAARWKVESCTFPETQLSFKITKNKSNSEAFDRRIFLSAYKQGFDGIQDEDFREAPEFRFNVWCQSRTDEYIHRRVRALLQAVKREWERTQDDMSEPATLIDTLLQLHRLWCSFSFLLVYETVLNQAP
eukprot:gene4442-3241_t